MSREKKQHDELKSHERVNTSFLGAAEKRALRTIAGYLPAWVTPDRMTGLGFAAAILIAVSYWLTNYNAAFLWLASLGFIINWFGDSLDGTIARVRKIERPKFGYFIDHTVDAFTQFIIIIGIGMSPYVDITFALFFLVGYFMLSIQTYITTYVKGVFKLSYGKLGPTEVRVLAILANSALFFAGNGSLPIPELPFTFAELVFAGTGTAAIVMFVFYTMRQAAELSALEEGGRI